MRKSDEFVEVTYDVPAGYKLQRLHAWNELAFDWCQYIQRDTFHRKAIDRVVRTVRRIAPNLRRSKPGLIDLGCGPGFLLGELGRQNLFSRLAGIDFCPVMLELAKTQNLDGDTNIEYHRLDMESRLAGYRALAHKFDVATAAFLLDEVGDAATCFRSVAYFLRPGGYFVTATLVPERERLRYASRLRRLPSNSPAPILLSKGMRFEGRRAPVSYFRLIRQRNEIVELAAGAGFQKLRDQNISAAQLHSRARGPFLRLLVFQLKG